MTLAGEDVNQRLTSENLTPLHLAVHYGTETICMILLKQKADANSRDMHGMTPAHYVALRGQFLRNPTYYNIYERILQNLINFGANLNIQAKDGSTAIDIA